MIMMNDLPIANVCCILPIPQQSATLVHAHGNFSAPSLSDKPLVLLFQPCHLHTVICHSPTMMCQRLLKLGAHQAEEVLARK